MQMCCFRVRILSSIPVCIPVFTGILCVQLDLLN
jgi:hypothetical protein